MTKRLLKIAALVLFAFSFSMTLTEAGKKSFRPESSAEPVKAPQFSLKDIDGNQVRLADFKGKVVYLDFWASWCAPCLMQMNKAAELKEYFRDRKDVVFLYVSIDGSEDRWKTTIQKRNIEGIHLLSKDGQESDVVSKFNIRSIPRFMLIDRNGNIADNNAKPPSNKGVIKDIEKLLE